MIHCHFHTHGGPIHPEGPVFPEGDSSSPVVQETKRQERRVTRLECMPGGVPSAASEGKLGGLPSAGGHCAESQRMKGFLSSGHREARAPVKSAALAL